LNIYKYILLFDRCMDIIDLNAVFSLALAFMMAGCLIKIRY